MKKLVLSLIITALSALAFGQVVSTSVDQNSNDNTVAPSAWNNNNPFSADVFVENLGQFDSWAGTSEPIKYAINSSNKIFFTSKGIVFRCDKVTAKSEAAKEEFEREYGREAAPEIDSYYITMTWEGCNENTIMESSGQSVGYFTFGENGYENIRAKGFKKLVYKDIYTGIDVEYMIPEKGGIKYSLILHPGADISKVKMKYSGDVSLIKQDAEGNVNISTPAGDIVDHHPESFYQDSKTAVNSAFALNDHSVSFKLSGLTSSIISDETVIIDPWTISPTTLTTDNSAFDIECDNAGNVYVGGGTVPFKVAKYTSAGTLIWTFTNPSGWASGTYYSKFCVLPISGTVYISEGFNYSSGPAIMKINQSGNLVLTSANFAGSNEIWMMFYNRCAGKLIGFGGGTSNNNNLQMIADTNLTNSSAINLNAYSGACCNDITSATMDNNTDFYLLMSSASGIPSVNNKLQKSLYSANYLPPCAFDVASGYSYDECYNYGITGFLGGNTVRANALAVNNSYLYSYDGMTLKAWDKTNGTMLGSVIVDAGYAAGAYRTHEGIAVDICNHVYVGGTGLVHRYTFNGTTFIPFSSITTNGEVYDLTLNKSTSLLLISGFGFVTVVTDNLSCGENIDTCIVTSAFQSVIQNAISIFPNPVPDKLTVEISERSEIEIFNIHGQLIKTLTATEPKTLIDVSTLPNGVYIVQVKTEKGVGVRKFVKE